MIVAGPPRTAKVGGAEKPAAGRGCPRLTCEGSFESIVAYNSILYYAMVCYSTVY